MYVLFCMYHTEPGCHMHVLFCMYHSVTVRHMAICQSVPVPRIKKKAKTTGFYYNNHIISINNLILVRIY
jgi:hypothetical protein